jgi:hypothetical protein
LLRAICCIGLAILAAALDGCWEGITRGTLATVVAVDGTVFAAAPSQNDSPVRAGDAAKPGTVFQTKENSHLAISLLPNSVIQAGPGTALEIGRLALTKDGNETGSSVRGRHAEMTLKAGRLIVSHAWGEAPAQLSVATPQGNAVTPSNAVFCVETDGALTRVTCATGWIEFQSPGTRSVQIPPGSMGEWRSGSARVIPVETDPTGQETLQVTIEAEENLKTLVANRVNVLPR